MIMLFKMASLLLLSISIIGCAGVRSRVNSYSDPSFNPGNVKSIAILPMQNGQLSLGDSLQINRAIQQGISKVRPEIKLISSVDSVKLINDNSLSDDYANFIKNYYVSGVPNRDTLRKLGVALSADVIMQGGLINVSQSDGNSWDRKGSSQVVFKYWAINCDDAVIVWDSTAECQAWTATEYEQAPTVMDVVGPALNKMFMEFPIVKIERLLPLYKIEDQNTDNANATKGSRPR